MINSNNFSLALDILHKLTHQAPVSEPLSGQFSQEYQGQGLITTALKIIHTISREGTAEQRSQLSSYRHEIVALNSLLSHKLIGERVRDVLHIEMGDEASKLENIRVAVPQTKFEKMIEIATLIPRVIFSILVDLALLPIAGGLSFYMLTKPNFDPLEPKTGKIPILLLHGSGFNESQWVFGRQFLKKQEYGSVFSLNYAGLLSNDSTKGIDDYAAGKVRDKILEIKKLTGQNQVILVGHSMGGMIAGYYAENLSLQDKVKVEHVISVGSPWRGSPTVDLFKTGPAAPKRYPQMSTENQFRQNLVSQALASERGGCRNYYTVGSTTDLAVPGLTSLLSEDPRRQRIFSYLGHFGIVASPRVWSQVRSWLDQIYA